MISNLVFTSSASFSGFFLESEENSINFLPRTNRVNLFIGANNSGKSFFMRKLMELKQYNLINDNFFNEYNNIVDRFNNDAQRKTSVYRGVYKLEKIILNKDINNVIDENTAKINVTRFNIEKSYRVEFDLVKKDLIKLISLNNKYFLPTLRTAHSLFEVDDNIKKVKKVQEDIYKQTLIKNYPSLKKDVDLFTGLDFYEQILNARNSDKETRNNFQAFEDFLSVNFFNNKQIDVVAEFKYNENKIGSNESELILIHIEGEEKTQKLYELGDGIQAIIILLYKIFMAEDNSFFFIDEPELNLHPGMQRLFLEQIISNEILKKKNLTYFITTHSNHFLDISIEKDNISIYTFSNSIVDSKKKFIIKNVNSGENEVLRNLGVNNSSVFMANCSIWVEGVSDRNYIKAFLKSYCTSKNKIYPKEDIDFAFFEYAGSNYLHYNFSDDNYGDKIKAFALNNRILFLADVDNNKDLKHKELFDIARNNFQYETTKEFREIENILPNIIWEKVLINFIDKRKLKSKVETDIQAEISDALSKHRYDDYKGEYVGVFLSKLKIIDLNKIWEGNVPPKSFLYKAELSNIILDKVNNNQITWDDFKANPFIVELTEKIYNFITKNN